MYAYLNNLEWFCVCMCMYVCMNVCTQRIRQLEGSSRGLIGNIRQQAEKHVAELTNLREQIQVRTVLTANAKLYVCALDSRRV